MPIRDDEQFEKYLRQFRPLEPEPLALVAMEARVRARRRPLKFVAWAAVAAAILAAVMLAVRIYQRPSWVPDAGQGGARIERQDSPRPLTIESANALLAGAPSFKEAVDNMAFQSSTTTISPGKRSALAALSKEETRRWTRYDSQH